jgi:hypothetical protein
MKIAKFLALLGRRQAFLGRQIDSEAHDYQQVLSQLTTLLNSDSSLSNAQQHALRALRQALIDFLQTYSNCRRSSTERSILIEKQVKRHAFIGNLHDAYHEASQAFQTDYHTHIQNAKRLANATSIALEVFIPHDQKRGLRFASFGKLYESIKRTNIDEQSQYGSFLTYLARVGDDIEEAEHRYRDEVLEHPRPEGHATYLYTSNSRVEVGNPFSQEYSPNPMTLGPGKVFRIDIPESGNPPAHRYYVHVDPNEALTPGSWVDEGALLGHVADPGYGHFGKYGDHCHVFDSPGADLGYVFPVRYNMPAFVEVTNSYVDMCQQLLNALRRPG